MHPPATHPPAMSASGTQTSGDQPPADGGPVYAAIESGGTKWICALADADGRILARTRFLTRDPASTLAEAANWLQAATAAHAGAGAMPAALGIASFGPLELDPTASRYGRLLRTPKPGWSDTDLLAPFRTRFPGMPLALDTDVNAAALAEAAAFAHHEGRAPRSLVYVTVGTGIGGGVVVDGRPLHGLLHPELGHLHPRRHADDLNQDGAPFAGICPYHGDCLEGLASGPALQARLGHGLDTAAPDHPVWAVQADYLGQFCAQIALALSPERIVLGGGVMQQSVPVQSVPMQSLPVQSLQMQSRLLESRLMPLLRARTRHWLGGYLDRAQTEHGIDQWIVLPACGEDSGLLGALQLARGAAR